MKPRGVCPARQGPSSQIVGAFTGPLSVPVATVVTHGPRTAKPSLSPSRACPSTSGATSTPRGCRPTAAAGPSPARRRTRAWQPGAKKAIQDICNAEDREYAAQAIKTFEELYGAKSPKAVKKITDDQEELLAFFDSPAEH